MSHSPALLLSIILAASATMALAQAPEDLVANGGFETLGDDGRPELFSVKNGEAWSAVPEAARTGNLGIRMEPAPDDLQWLRQHIEKPATQLYTVSCWFRANNVVLGSAKESHLRLYVHVLYEGRPYSDSSHFYTDPKPGTYDWTCVRVRVTPKTLWPISQVWITVTSQFAEGVLDVDDLKMEAKGAQGGANALEWTNCASPIMLTDLSQCEPGDALADKRLKNKWKVLSYEMGSYKGNMLSANYESDAPPVTLPLNASGWHAVYVGFMGDRLRVKLTSDLSYVGRSKTAGRVEEIFFKAADLTGERLHFAQQSKGGGQACDIVYVKLVPLTNEEVARIQAERADPSTKRLCTTIDGFSYLYSKGCTTEEELLEETEEYRHSDFGTLYLQVTGAETVNYATKVGAHYGIRDGELIPVFDRPGDRVYSESLLERIKNGVNATEVQIRGAKDVGMTVYVCMRPGAWNYEPPSEEFFSSPLYENHPEWRCIDRDGTPVARLSYAVPEVRRHLVEVLREAVRFGADGVGVLYNRGLPTVLWEEPFCKLFQDKYGEDAREVPEADPRITELRVEIMTGFMEQIRQMLDEEEQARGEGTQLKIAAMVLANEADNIKYGVDVRGWVEKGLLDDIGPYLGAGGGSAKELDLAFFREVCEPRGIPWRPTIVAWGGDTMQEIVKRTREYYAGGATGVTFWDGNSLSDRTDAWSVVSRLGHVDGLADLEELGSPETMKASLQWLGGVYLGSRYSVNWGF